MIVYMQEEKKKGGEGELICKCTEALDIYHKTSIKLRRFCFW